MLVFSPEYIVLAMRVIFERCIRTKILRNLYKLFCYSSLVDAAKGGLGDCPAQDIEIVV